MYILVGLGNPGDEYTLTRHNVGRIILDHIYEEYDFSEWQKDSKAKAIISKGEIDGNEIMLIKPNNFMNNSGGSLERFITSKKKLANTAIIYDDIDLPSGSFKISFNRGSGGHRGVESIIKKMKSKEFSRIRIGITPATPKGKLKKPKGEQKVLEYIMGNFKKKELDDVKKLSKKISEAVVVLLKEGPANAMNLYN